MEKFNLNVSSMKSSNRVRIVLNKKLDNRNKINLANSTGSHKHIRTSNKHAMIEELQDDGINTTANSKLSCDPKLHARCMILIEKFHVSTGSNYHIESGNKNTSTISTTKSQNTGRIISTISDSMLLCDDPKLNLQCMVLIEKFNISMRLNKHTESSNKNTVADYTLSIDPKFNVRCMILIEKFDINENIKMKSSNNFSNNIKTTLQKNPDRCDSNGNKINWKNCFTFTDESTETNCKVQNETCTNDENKWSAKVKIETHLNQSTLLRKQMEKNSAETSLNKINTGALINKNVSIYEKQQIEDNKSREPIDLYEFHEFDSNKMKTLRNRKYNKNSRKINKPINKLEKINRKKTKRRIKNKNKIDIESPSKKYEETMQEIIQKIMNKVHTKNCSENLEHEIPTPNINSISAENGYYTDENSSEEFFNFNCKSHSTPSKINLNINNSNVTVNEKDSTNLFNNIKPSANSTMLPSDKYSPWRFSENVKRNPHFIIIKKTALPCLQQDMVLDYIQLKKIEEHFSKSQKNIENLKTKPLQKRILEFMNVSSYDVIDQENIHHSNAFNLFDYDEFSPKKIMLQNCSKNEFKHNILTPKQNNSKNVQVNVISTQNKPISKDKSLIRVDVNNEMVLHKDENTFLKARKYKSGNQDVFKRCTKEVTQTEILEQNLHEPLKCQSMNTNKENNKTISSKCGIHENNDTDTYFEMNDVNNEVVHPGDNTEPLVMPYQVNQSIKSTKEVAGISVPDLKEFFESESVMFNKEGGLFEDLGQVISFNMPSKIYESKKQKRRLLSEVLDEDESKSKKKNIMTKEEDTELQKWATGFNSKCEEIEKYRLDIE